MNLGKYLSKFILLLKYVQYIEIRRKLLIVGIKFYEECFKEINI